jgi:ABC-type molybdenum transport system ATPase subunit/photorepair protein PhrA
MSCDIKYIGMDVHKEATVIAVLNGSGKLVMESIVETEVPQKRSGEVFLLDTLSHRMSEIGIFVRRDKPA